MQIITLKKNKMKTAIGHLQENTFQSFDIFMTDSNIINHR